MGIMFGTIDSKLDEMGNSLGWKIPDKLQGDDEDTYERLKNELVKLMSKRYVITKSIIELATPENMTPDELQYIKGFLIDELDYCIWKKKNEITDFACIRGGADKLQGDDKATYVRLNGELEKLRDEVYSDQDFYASIIKDQRKEAKITYFSRASNIVFYSMYNYIVVDDSLRKLQAVRAEIRKRDQKLDREGQGTETPGVGIKAENLIEQIEAINEDLAKIEEKVKKNPNYDAESIERTKLKIRKYNLQKELRDLLQQKGDKAPGDKKSRRSGTSGARPGRAYYDKDRQKKLDLIASSEIEHIGTWDTIMRANSKAKIATPWNIGSAAAVAAVGAGSLILGAAGVAGAVAYAPVVAGVAAAPMLVTGAIKLAGKLNNIVRGTNRKEAAMRERIDQMQQEDFDLLVDSLTKADILNEKYGEVWLECIADRLGRDNARRNAETDERISSDMQTALECQRNGTNLPEDVRLRLDEAKKEKEIRGAKLDDLRDATDLKSHRKKNTRGRIGGVFNPDRTEFNTESADLYRKIGEATTQAEREDAIAKYQAYRAKNVDNRSHFGGKIIFYKGILNNAQDIEIEKGKISEFNVDRSEPKFMKRLSQLAIRAGGILTVTGNINDQISAQNQADAANAQIDQANTANQAANQTNQVAQNLVDKIQQDLENAPTDQAIDDYTQLLINDTFLQGHNKQFIMDQLGRFNESGADAALHQDLESLTQQFLQTATTDQKLQFLQDTVIPTWQKGAQDVLNTPEAIQYIQDHPEFNMDSLWDNTKSLAQDDALSSVSDSIKATTTAAKELKNVAIQDYTQVGNVAFSVPSHLVQQVLVNGAGILHSVRDALGIKKKEKPDKETDKNEGKTQPKVNGKDDGRDR